MLIAASETHSNQHGKHRQKCAWNLIIFAIEVGFNMKYNIALYTAYYAPHIGGVERFVESLADKLQSQGHCVTIFTSASSFSDQITNTGTRLITIPSFSIMGDRFPLPKPTPSCLRALQAQKEVAFDAVIVNTRYYPISLMGCLTAKRNKIQPIIIDHSSGFLSKTDSIAGFAIRIWEQAMTSLLNLFKPNYYGVSQGSVRWLKSLRIDANGVIPNSIDADAYKQINSNIDWRAKLSIGEDTCIVSYVGRLVPEKGVTNLIAAMKQIAGAEDDVALVIAGNGPLEQEVKQATSHSVYYVGPLAPADISSLFASSDIFCLPTEYPEGLPTVLLEAASQNNAIVVSNCAGAKEVIPDDSYGTIVSSTAPNDIAEAILHYVRNPKEREEASVKVNHHIAHAFSWDATASKVVRLIDESLHK